MKYILSLFIIFITLKGKSQDAAKSKIDSMLKVVERLDKNEYPYGITLSLRAYDDSKKIGYIKGMAESLLIASREQYELGKFDDVLLNTTEAEKLAFEISDYKLISDALRLKGISLTRIKNFTQGKKELQKALLYAHNLNNKETKSSRIGVIYNDIAFNIDQNSGPIDSVAYFYGKGYKEFEKMALSNSLKNKTLSLACSNVGSSFLRAKELDSAQFYLNRALQLANSVDHKVVQSTILNDLGSLYYLKKDFSTSISYFEKGISIAKEINDPFILKSLFLGASKSYNRLNDNINSKAYLEQYISLSDSLKSNGKLSDEDQSLLVREKKILHPGDTIRTLVMIVMFFIVVTGGLYLGVKKIKNKKALGTQSLELDVNSIIFTEQVVQNSEENQLKKLAHLATSDDPAFLMSFKEAYPDFFRQLNLINPSLIAGEQKLCALLRLNFTTKNIALATNSSVRAVESKKYRLRKKLAIPSDDDINIWIMNV